jgi:hypothetical protein
MMEFLMISIGLPILWCLIGIAIEIKGVADAIREPNRKDRP